MIPLIFAALLLAPASRAETGDVEPRHLWRATGEYLYYLPVNSGSGLDNQLASMGNGLIEGGYDSTRKSLSTTGGAGARLSLMRRWDERTDLGASLDYVLGPTMNADFHAYSTAFGDGGLTINRSGTFVRLMGQARIQLMGKAARQPGDWNLEIGSSFGPGLGHIEQTCQASGSLTCPVNSTHLSWIGLAWEFGPRVEMRVRDIDIGAAILAAGFPRYKGNADIATLEWETMGFSLSAEF